jgi:hypothetical protein
MRNERMGYHDPAVLAGQYSYRVTETVTGAKFGIWTETEVTVADRGGYSDVIRTGSGPTWLGNLEQTQ